MSHGATAVAVRPASVAVQAIGPGSPWLTAASVATAINAVLLVVLLAVWIDNYRTFGSKHALGLTIFGAFLLAENLLTFNYYVINTQVASYLAAQDPIAGRAMMSVAILQTVALAFLTWVTLD
jgi:hypothetical protein